MPAPFGPNAFKESVPSVTGSFCERFKRALTINKLIHELVSWMITEEGEINPDGLGADICALECMGGDGTTPGGTGTTFGFPQNVSASDGQYQDKVVITWSSVFSATTYDVYRNIDNNTGTATLLGSTASTSFEDGSADAGVQYYYWVRARNDTQTSNFSSPDQGFRAVTLTAVSDLQATKGFTRTTNPFINLVFNPVPGATQYDFYISETNDFADADLLDAGRTPFENSESFHQCNPSPCTKPVFLNQAGELLYVYRPTAIPDFYAKKYFWVKAKTVSNNVTTAITPESNAAEGWAVGKGDGVIPTFEDAATSGDASIATPAGASEAWVVLYGSGGGGAGGGTNNGGGGGGGGAMLIGWRGVAAGSRMRVTSTPESDTGNAAAFTNGGDSPLTVLEYSADGTFTDTIVLLTANVATGGVFQNGANGAGGSGASGAAHPSINDIEIFDGRDGRPADGTKGGRAGNRFGGFSKQAAHWNGFNAFVTDTGNGGTSGAGGGSYSDQLAPNLCTGGSGARGYAFAIYY